MAHRMLYSSLIFYFLIIRECLILFHKKYDNEKEIGKYIALVLFLSLNIVL